MAEFAPGVNEIGSVVNSAFDWKDEISGLTSVSRPPLPSPLRQILGQLLIPALARIDVLIDRLVAQSGRRTTGKPQPSGNLLRRPAALQPIRPLRKARDDAAACGTCDADPQPCHAPSDASSPRQSELQGRARICVAVPGRSSSGPAAAYGQSGLACYSRHASAR